MSTRLFYRNVFLARLFAIAARLIAFAALLFAGAGPLPVLAQSETPPETAAEASALIPEMTASTPLTGQLLADVVQVAAGGIFTCALTNYGGVFCWGSNPTGQLGNGTKISSSIPVPVNNLGKGVKAIAAGTSHACALLESGYVMCWGDNTYGKLGDGTSSLYQLSPVMVQKLVDMAISITAGESHTCAVLASGTVQCWGYNLYGQLGDGTEKNSPLPVAVLGLADKAKSVTAGNNHTCAVLYNGGMQCWGYNIYGQVGDGTMDNSRYLPVKVIDLAGDVSSAGAGQFHTCALLITGDVQCWGYNNYGQLGDGSTISRKSPGDFVKLREAAITIEAGSSHTCAVSKTGAIQCWGLNASSQLGDGTSANRLAPVYVIGLAVPAALVSGGVSHTCAVINSDGTVQCWGSNSAFQLGNGYQQKYNQPIQVPSLKSEFVAAGNGAACAIDTAGAVYCWGSNLNGKLGDGTTIDHNTPEPVSGLTSAVLNIQYGLEHACVLTNDVYPVKCWGDNVFGQLGNRSNTDSSIPVNVELIGKVTAISVGDYHTCALLGDGSVQCWGRGVEGQLGDGKSSNNNVPVAVQFLNGKALLISGGGAHTCAATDNLVYPVQCWGKNTDGQLGNNSTNPSSLPVNVEKIGGAVQDLAAGYNHTCVVLQTGEMMCWGSDSYGQLGDNDIQHLPKLLPVYVLLSAADPVVKASAGQSHTCALLKDGSLKCWGFNMSGQVGDLTYVDKAIPTSVARLNHDVTQVSAGVSSSCAAQTGGTIYCWGNNTQGQVGLGAGSIARFPDWVLAPLELGTISPTSGMNDLPVRVTLRGSGFQDSSIVRLDSIGVELDDVYLVDGHTLTGSVPADTPAGRYYIKMTAPSGNVVMSPQTYEVLDSTLYNDLYAYPMDFVIEAVDQNRASISKSVYIGKEARLSLVVRRMGTNPTTTNPFKVTFYASNPIYKSATVIGQAYFPYGLGPDQMARSPYVYWTPTMAGTVYLYAKIDSWGEVQELPAENENNNVISRMVRVLPWYDMQPPEVKSVTIAGGQDFTTTQKVTITSVATDNIGVTNLLFTEYTFVQSRGNWEPVQRTGWLPYSTSVTDFPWLLDPTPGVHYIKVWAADRVGNISLRSGMAFINYMPERDYLAPGEFRIFRQNLKMGDQVTLTLKRFYGSATLYLWPPYSTTPSWSYTDPLPYPFVADPDGQYQYAVEGFRRLLFRGGTSYNLSVTVGGGRGAPLPAGEPSLMARGIPGSDSLPADDDTGVEPVPVLSVYLPTILK